MAAYRRVYDSRHLQADCQAPGSAPEPYARQSSMGYLYFFLSSLTTLASFIIIFGTRSFVASGEASTGVAGRLCAGAALMTMWTGRRQWTWHGGS